MRTMAESSCGPSWYRAKGLVVSSVSGMSGPAILEAGDDFCAGDAVRPLDVAVPAEGEEIWRRKRPAVSPAVGVKIAPLGGDEVAESPRAAVTGPSGARGNAVGPAVGRVTHLDCLSQVFAELVEPGAFLASFRPVPSRGRPRGRPGPGPRGGEGRERPGPLSASRCVPIAPLRVSGGQADQGACAVGGDPWRVLAELGFTGQQPAAFGLDDD